MVGEGTLRDGSPNSYDVDQHQQYAGSKSGLGRRWNRLEEMHTTKGNEMLESYNKGRPDVLRNALIPYEVSGGWGLSEGHVRFDESSETPSVFRSISDCGTTTLPWLYGLFRFLALVHDKSTDSILYWLSLARRENYTISVVD